MSKRAASDLDLYEEKPDLTSSDGGSDGYTPSSSKGKKAKKPRISKKGAGTSASADESENKAPKRVWTPEEDRIFLDIMGALVKGKMWEAVSQDGRLAYRGNPGIRAHVIAIMKKLKKA